MGRDTYCTFTRAARNWEEFASAKKVVHDRGLTEEEARAACQEWNANRSAKDVKAGRKMEYTQGDSP
jgi:hypothetical protein